jgi:hypothetical protein
LAGKQKGRISMRPFFALRNSKNPRARKPGVRQWPRRQLVEKSISLPLSFIRTTVDFADFELTVGIMYTTVTATEDVLRFN